MPKTSVVSLDEELPAPFAGVLQILGLTQIVTSSDTFDPFVINPHATIIIVKQPTVTKLRGRLARLLEPTLDSGALLLLIADSTESFKDASIILQERVRVAEPTHPIVDLHDVYPTVRLIHSDVDEFSRLIRTHDSGLASEHQMVLTVQGDPDSPSDLQLLRRAFSGFTQISLSKSHGGRSGSDVWQVEALDGARCSEPFIAKAGSRASIEDEHNTWKRLILDYVPFPYRSPPVEDRLVQGARRAVLVSRFVDRATRFDDYVTQVNDSGSPVAALFNGALRNCRCNAEPPRDVRLGKIYVEQMEEDTRQRDQDQITGRIPRSILPSVDRLSTAFELARKSDENIPGPEQLVDALRRVGKIEIRQCFAHGDLNARNLFVTWSGSQIVLIDFSHAISPAYLSRDPSRLEVSLAFDVAKKNRENHATEYLTPNDLRGLYCYPLLPCISLPRRQDGRIEAVHQIRRHVMGEGVTNEEYSLTTACHLLRFARNQRDDEQLERRQLRALSYSLAVRIIFSLPRA